MTVSLESSLDNFSELGSERFVVEEMVHAQARS